MSEEINKEPQQKADINIPAGGLLPTLPPDEGKAGGSFSVRGLAEGAMMAAISVILAVISLYVPILNIIAPLLFPVPLALLVLRHGLKLSLFSALSIFFLSAMLLGLPHALYLFTMYGFLGLFFGWCFRQHKKAAFTLLGGLLISSLAILVSLIYPTLVAGVSVDQYLEMSSTIMHEYVNILQQQGGDLDSVLGGMSPAAFLSYMEELMQRLLPSIFISMAMSLTLLCYVLMCKLLRRFGYDVSKLPPFREWRLDWRLLWAVIVALALAGLGQRLDIDLMARIGDNMLMAFSPILLVCGISMAVWLLMRWRVATFFKVIVTLFFLQIFGGGFNIFVLIGVFDPIFDFRRRIEGLEEKRKAA